MNIFVGNLAFTATEAEVRQIRYHPQSGWFDEGPQRGPALL